MRSETKRVCMACSTAVLRKREYVGRRLFDRRHGHLAMGIEV